MNIEEFLLGLEVLEREKGISQASIIEALEQAIANGYQREQKDINKDAVFRAKLFTDTGEIRLWTMKTVVEEVGDRCESFEISLEDAQKINPEVALDDEIEVEVTDPEDLSRMAILHAKQILRQKLREAERQAIVAQYSDKISQVIPAVVEKVEPGFVTVDLGKTYALMKRKDLIPGEQLSTGQTIKVFVSSVEGSSGSQITVSRTDPGLVRKLFEQEIHEVYDGTIVIKAIVREAGFRTKVAVATANPNVDATGSCIGQRGTRIINISSQLNGEKIDVIEYIEDAALFIIEAMKPAQVVGLVLNDNLSAVVIVRNDDLSQAIGRSGINIRLASRITGWALDVKTEAAAREEEIEYITPEALRLAFHLKLKEKARAQLEKREEEKPVPMTIEEGYNEYKRAVDDGEAEEEEEATPVETLADVTPKPTPATEPVKEEEPEVVEKVQIKGRTKIKLSDLERQLELERQAKPAPAQPAKRKDKDKDEKGGKKKDLSKEEEEIARRYMPVYTEEELEELEDDDDDDDDFNVEEYEYFEEE